jgi:hypothetical protein
MSTYCPHCAGDPRRKENVEPHKAHSDWALPPQRVLTDVEARAFADRCAKVRDEDAWLAS